MNIDPEIFEKLAEEAHNVWMEGKLRDGWTYGHAIDKGNKMHNCLVPYCQLSDLDKESDRDLVHGIPRILDLAGYAIVKKEET